MRFYRIELTNPLTGEPILPSSLGGLQITSLLPSGQFNPAALNVEMDLPVGAAGTPGEGQAIVTIWGLGLKDITTAWGLGIQPSTGAADQANGARAKVFGGMSKGLPLANPAQQGPLVIGQVIQAFGNWIGTEQTVSLILGPADGDTGSPKNIVLNWQAGQPLSVALENTLRTAFPGIPVRTDVSPNLIQSHTEAGYYGSLEQLGDVVGRLSRSIVRTPGYAGVQIVNNGSNITVTDFTKPPAAKALAFQDMIGQPTWIDAGVVQIKLVMRGDLSIGDVVSIPASLKTTTAQSNLTLSGFSTFSGDFVVLDLHHYGNFRQPDAGSWNTTINVTPNLPDAGAR